MENELNYLFHKMKVEENFLEPPEDIDILFNTVKIDNEIQVLFSLECNNNSRGWNKLDFCITVDYNINPSDIIYKIWTIIDKILF